MRELTITETEEVSGGVAPLVAVAAVVVVVGGASAIAFGIGAYNGYKRRKQEIAKG